jgi:sec-independent protein translocase protein TatB
MFDLSWSHILIVLVVALVVVGPKDLPKIMRTAGRWMGKARAMADQFRKSFDEMARQSELDELRAEIQALRTHQPLAEIEQSMNQSILPPDPAPAPAGQTHVDAQAHLVDVPDPVAAPHEAVSETPHP